MKKIETSNFLFIYEIPPIERLIIKQLINNRYKELTNQEKDPSHSKLEHHIGLECHKSGKDGISISTIRRLKGQDSGFFKQKSLDAVLTYLDIQNFEDLNGTIQNIIGCQSKDPQPLNINSFLYPHKLFIQLSNGQKLRLHYLSGDKFDVIESTIPNIEPTNRLILYQLILNQQLHCMIQTRESHPEYVNHENPAWVYNDQMEYQSENITVKSINFEERSAYLSEVQGVNSNHISDILDIRDNVKNPLDKLQANTSALWYCSAGTDFRSPVFFSQGYLDILYQHRRVSLGKPKLFVFNCLGREVTELKQKLKGNRFVDLFDDKKTKITGNNYCEFSLKSDKVDFQINPANFHMSFMPELDPDVHAFYFDITIQSTEFAETHPVLYFEMENHNFFHQVVLGQYFNVKYFCTTGEGVAFGGNKKSMVKEIYELNNPLYYAEKGFKPELIIHDGGTANQALCFADKNSELKLTPDFTTYFSRTRIPENTFKSKFWGITKIDYPENISDVPRKYPEPDEKKEKPVI